MRHGSALFISGYDGSRSTDYGLVTGRLSVEQPSGKSSLLSDTPFSLAAETDVPRGASPPQIRYAAAAAVTASFSHASAITAHRHSPGTAGREVLPVGQIRRAVFAPRVNDFTAQWAAHIPLSPGGAVALAPQGGGGSLQTVVKGCPLTNPVNGCITAVGFPQAFTIWMFRKSWDAFLPLSPLSDCLLRHRFFTAYLPNKVFSTLH